MDYPMRDRESREPTTVLDHLRPTVVRRRVVVDVAALNQQKRESPAAAEPMPERSSGGYPRAGAALEDDGPPSSIIAPEAYDALVDAGDELDEHEEEQEEDDRAPSTREPDVRAYEALREEEVSETEGQLQAPAQPSVGAAPVADARPTIPVGPTIAVGTIAKRLGLASAQVAAELVSRGFFEVTPATVLTRETARIVAEAFGRAVEEVPDPEPVKARRKRTARRAAPTKRTAKSAKPKKRAGRSTRRAA